MALPPSFGLIHSEFNAFLFALIGEEPNGNELSVVSTLTRLNIDPWREAELLAGLRQDEAVQALTTTIAGFPGGTWQPTDARKIAARLVALLPRPRVVQRAGGSARGTQLGAARRPLRLPQLSWMTWTALAALALLIWSFLL